MILLVILLIGIMLAFVAAVVLFMLPVGYAIRKHADYTDWEQRAEYTAKLYKSKDKDKAQGGPGRVGKPWRGIDDIRGAIPLDKRMYSRDIGGDN